MLLVLLVPTNGDFNPWFVFSCKQNKECFEQNDIGDLHIGITNSKSDVYDFDRNGLKKNTSIWFQIPSIIIRLDKSVQTNFLQHENEDEKSNNLNFKSKEFSKKWDLALERNLLNNDKWNKINYDEENFNCLDFVIEHFLEFEFFDFHLKNLQNEFVKKVWKKKISHDLIEPEFIKCLKYLNLIEMLNEKEIFEEKLI